RGHDGTGEDGDEHADDEAGDRREDLACRARGAGRGWGGRIQNGCSCVRKLIWSNDTPLVASRQLSAYGNQSSWSGIICRQLVRPATILTTRSIVPGGGATWEMSTTDCSPAAP